ncbi:MAG: hypothetical protein ACE5NG_19675 [bacterium]
MSQNLAEIVQPLVEKGLFENAETAIRNLMTDYVLHQIEHYRDLVQKYEKKYGMKYAQFNHYLKERAKKLEKDSSLHKTFMTEEENALEWKIATEMLESWLGLREKLDHE